MNKIDRPGICASGAAVQLRSYTYLLSFIMPESLSRSAMVSTVAQAILIRSPGMNGITQPAIATSSVTPRATMNHAVPKAYRTTVPRTMPTGTAQALLSQLRNAFLILDLFLKKRSTKSPVMSTQGI